MADQQQGRSLWQAVNASWPTLVGLGTAVIIAVLSFPTLESSRPPAAKVRPLETIGVQNVDARLWQDPLDVVTKHAEEQKGPDAHEHTIADLREQVKTLNGTALVLPVMVGGSPYAEDGESRIRTRVAVASALGRAHYVPQDGEHVGYFEIRDWPRTDSAGAAGLNESKQESLSEPINTGPGPGGAGKTSSPRQQSGVSVATQSAAQSATQPSVADQIGSGIQLVL